ncbi:MAG: cobalt-precorrin-5B (C(1))-methyltransferase [Deltaproteobacteria bacterium]|nr:cobalt-precorrin-5B (C(1))-methyltransferase [Deltaproteobacteria bacterium]
MASGRKLRSGYTTGACAAAAAKGAALLLLGREPAAAVLRLPWGDPQAREVAFPLVGCAAGEGWASCGVVKDAGDDPDATDGLEIRAAVAWSARDAAAASIEIDGGEGVGRVTKPGLAAPVGGAAINPVPRAMIETSVQEALAEAGVSVPPALRVVVTVPRGGEVARKTLNARLGIEGGLSILGTTGIVIPMSTDAWRATIDACLDVARATGVSSAVLAHGRSSEAAARRLFPELSPEAFVLMGDHVGYALEAAARRGLGVVLAGQFAKFCKVAAGHFATHVKDSTLDPTVLSRLLGEAGFPPAEAEAALGANTAREVFERLRAGGDRGVFAALTAEVARRASARLGGRVPLEALLFGYQKECLARVSLPASGPPGGPA